MKKVLSISGSVLVYSLIAFIVLVLYGMLIGNRWYRVIAVTSDSMKPTFAVGDLLVITPQKGKLELNQVVVMNVDGDLKVHRVVDFYPNGRPITKGDANEDPDDFLANNIEIMGIYRFRLPWMEYPHIFFTKLLHPQIN